MNILTLAAHQAANLRALCTRPAISTTRLMLLNSIQQANHIQQQQARCSSSFFTRLTGKELWKGVTSLSNVGRKRGRGRGTGARRAKDLNKGQVIGMGKKNVLWPGLSTPIIKGKETIRRQELPENKEYQTNLIKIRNEMEFRRRPKVDSLERGWSGLTLLGRWIGKPDPIEGFTFDGFDSKVVSLQTMLRMQPNIGRVRYTKAIVMTGNKNGLVGFGMAISKDRQSAIRRARARASVRLRLINLDGDTIVHDFYSRYGHSHVFAYKMPPGYGVVAHRVVRAICNVVGIKDIYCKIPNNTTNYLNITRAFIFGLANQRSFQQIANEKRLNLVEMRPENDYLPRLVARPDNGPVRKREEIAPDEVMEFRQYMHDGKIREIAYHKPPFYTRNIGYHKYMQAHHYVRSRQEVRIGLIAKYGKVESFLNVRERERREARKRELVASAASVVEDNAAKSEEANA